MARGRKVEVWGSCLEFKIKVRIQGWVFKAGNPGFGIGSLIRGSWYEVERSEFRVWRSGFGVQVYGSKLRLGLEVGCSGRGPKKRINDRGSGPRVKGHGLGSESGGREPMYVSGVQG